MGKPVAVSNMAVPQEISVVPMSLNVCFAAGCDKVCNITISLIVNETGINNV